jgi:hypothetical protein
MEVNEFFQSFSSLLVFTNMLVSLCQIPHEFCLMMTCIKNQSKCSPKINKASWIQLIVLSFFIFMILEPHISNKKKPILIFLFFHVLFFLM